MAEMLLGRPLFKGTDRILEHLLKITCPSEASYLENLHVMKLDWLSSQTWTSSEKS